MPKQSAGILLYKIVGSDLQVFLVHPGGPFYKNKDAGHWSIPKGEFLDDEEALTAARREFEEETGQVVNGDFIELKNVKLKSGKIIYAWALQGDLDQENITSNHFETEWPPKSGRKASFPEIDKADWFSTDVAKIKINAAQINLIEQLETIINGS